MPRLEPLSRHEVQGLDDVLDTGERLMGFFPNDGLTMARRPELLRAMSQLVATIYGAGQVDPELKRLVGQMASTAAGCSYCTAHAAHGAERQGADPARVAALWDYQTSPLFSAAERAALKLAQAAAVVPNATTDQDFDELKRHFDDGEIVELLAVIALFGFLNRWNSTLVTELEAGPLSFARRTLSPERWTPGRHAR
jgi:uncharacterized peroxidase-related enzyme